MSGPDQLVLSYADRLSDSAPSDIVFFDDCRADSEPIEELFYRWKADISGKSFLVSRSLVTSICSSQLPRQDQTKHCTCDATFNINTDIQRYCWACTSWYHVRCIKHGKFQKAPTAENVLGFQPSLSDVAGDILSHTLSMVPIERGGRFGINGNGNLQLQIRSVLKAGEDISSLIAEMDSKYVDSVSRVSFDYFSCPRCQSAI